MASLALGVATLLSGCKDKASSRFRFRLTIEIETPQGLKIGSSVYEVAARNKPGLDPSGSVREWSVDGQAVIVALSARKALISLLKTVNKTGHDDLAFAAMATLDPKFNYDYVESAGRIARAEGIRTLAELASANYPLMVAIGDLEQPETIVRLVPEDLAKDFGVGVRLKRVFLELTDDQVTRGIEKTLRWLPDVYARLRGRDFRPDGVPLGDFKRLFSTEL